MATPYATESSDGLFACIPRPFATPLKRMPPLHPSRHPSLLLKSSAPRTARGLLERERLLLSRLELRGAVIGMLAPAGFGKTTLLAQWRRQALASGGLAVWYSADARDEPLMFVRGLALSAQSVSGKRAFGEAFLHWLEGCTNPLDAMTGWLAEVAELSVEVMLLLDDADQLPTATRGELLPYLLGNAPANLRIALAARPTSALMASGALSIAPVTRVMASDLRFRMEETMAVLSATLGGPCPPEAAVRLHELTEGWPLGVQLAAASLHRTNDLEGLLTAATADIKRYFVERLIDHQPGDAVHLLVRLALFDLIHANMCEAVLGRADLSEHLARLQDETPLLLRTEGADWMRLHPIAREVLRGRLALLPVEERQVLSKKASQWYAELELYELAAEQSFLAGDLDTAVALVERTTHRMTVQGRSYAVLAWYERMSPEELKKHRGFWAPVAWALAMSEQHDQSEELIKLMLAHPQANALTRFEADLIRATAASFSDRVEVEAEVLQRWPEAPANASPANTAILQLTRGFNALYRGQPDQARLLWSRIAGLDRSVAYSPVSYGFADYGVGLCHLWEGRYVLAEQNLRPALIRAEERMDRRNPVASMLAALLAQACWESGQTDDPRQLLAGRLPVLAHYGLPEALIAAYRTLARVADHEGRQDQALEQLDELRAIGQERGLLRLQVAAQFELVSLHARHGRADSAQAVSAQLDALIRSRRHQAPDLMLPWLDLHAELARALAMLTRAQAVTGKHDSGSLAQVLQSVESAASLATSLKRGGEAVLARLLRAEVLRLQWAPDAQLMLNEALSLAQAGGMVRLLRDHGTYRTSATPTAEVLRDDPGQEPARLLSALRESVAPGKGPLTTKERDVLTLLSRNLSNKEIALAMGIGEQTIKWHIKNLFKKLNAGNRKHAVARARMLGFIDP